MQNRNEFEGYLKKHQWKNANEWLFAEIRFLRCKLTLQRIVQNTFGVLMSVVLALFTWVVLFPSADEKELKAFPMATWCHNLYSWLCSAVPGGKIAVIGGLLIAPFLVALVLAIAFYWIRPSRRKESDETANPDLVSQKIETLMRLYDKYDSVLTITLYTILAGLLTGGVMVVLSAPGGMNPFEYIFVGLICSVVHFAVMFGCAWLFYLFRNWLGVKWYPVIDWKRIVTEVIEGKKPKTSTHYSSSFSSTSGIESTDYYKEKCAEAYARYTGQPYETPEERAKRIAKEIEDELTGKGYGDY